VRCGLVETGNDPMGFSSAILGAERGMDFSLRRAGDGHLTTVAKQFEKARKEAGLPSDLVLYCARHGFRTEMYRATKNLFAVMNVMGHTTVSTTMKYPSKHR
jgi:integrase